MRKARNPCTELPRASIGEIDLSAICLAKPECPIPDAAEDGVRFCQLIVIASSVKRVLQSLPVGWGARRQACAKPVCPFGRGRMKLARNKPSGRVRRLEAGQARERSRSRPRSPISSRWLADDRWDLQPVSVLTRSSTRNRISNQTLYRLCVSPQRVGHAEALDDQPCQRYHHEILPLAARAINESPGIPARIPASIAEPVLRSVQNPAP